MWAEVIEKRIQPLLVVEVMGQLTGFTEEVGSRKVIQFGDGCVDEVRYEQNITG